MAVCEVSDLYIASHRSGAMSRSHPNRIKPLTACSLATVESISMTIVGSSACSAETWMMQRTTTQRLQQTGSYQSQKSKLNYDD